MDNETKKQIIEQFKTHEGDTGSPEVQIALLTYRINHLIRRKPVPHGMPVRCVDAAVQAAAAAE